MDKRTEYKRLLFRWRLVTAGIACFIPLGVVLVGFAFEWGSASDFDKQSAMQKGMFAAGMLLLSISVIYLPARLIFRNAVFKLCCDRCGRFINSRAKWDCGRCGALNLGGLFGSFLHRCYECHEEPTAIRCPHCKNVVFLDAHRTASNTATIFSLNFAPVAKKLGQATEILLKATFTEVARRAATEYKREEKLDELRFQEELEEALSKVYAKKRKRIEAGRGSPRSGALKSVVDSHREELEGMVHDSLAADEAASEVQRKYEKTYENDLLMRQKIEQIVHSWREGRIM